MPKTKVGSTGRSSAHALPVGAAGVDRAVVGTQLALALDAISLGVRFVVLTVSVVYRGCGGCPLGAVAWVVLPAGTKGAWRKEWLRRRRLIHLALPADWRVIVLADRGLYAGWPGALRARRIVRLHWHPFLRINNGAKFRPTGCAHWYWLKDLVGTVGQAWQGRGSCFKDPTARLDCTLLAWWGEGHADSWFVLTDLAPTAGTVTWYGLRTWCEQGFKCTGPRGLPDGWQWQLTALTRYQTFDSWSHLLNFMFTQLALEHPPPASLS